jgi:hypothetical protein
MSCARSTSTTNSARSGSSLSTGFAPTTTYELLWEKRSYSPKAILGTAYELATGKSLASGDFEGGKAGAVKVLGNLGFDVQAKRRSA